MKQLKVIVEIRREDFENELAEYLSKGFNIISSNITISDKYIWDKKDDGNVNLTNVITKMVNPSEYNSIKNSIIYYAIVIKES